MTLSEQLSDILASLGGFSPAGWLSVGFCLLLVVELIGRGQKPGRVRSWLSLLSIGILAGAGVWAAEIPTRGYLFMRLLYIDNQAIFAQLVVAVAAVVVLLYERFTTSASAGAEPSQPTRLPMEWYALLVAMTLGLFLMSVSVNLLSVYLSIELVSICSYLLTALTATRRASEGGIKYLLFGAVSSAVMLYGMSLLYGMTGTLDLTANAFGAGLLQQEGPVAAVALLLTGAGLLFKIAGVPFHVWTPDAYEAAPIPVAAFFSVGPKMAGILVLMRVVTALPMDVATGQNGLKALQIVLSVLALAGILLGNLSALRQTDAKRLLAYSTIAHAGFLLVGVVALNQAGFEAALFYVGTYLFMSLAAFFLVDLLARSTGPSEADPDALPMRELAGLGSQQPVLAVALTVVMLALTGLPPTVGFTAKLLSFSALYDAYQQTNESWLLALFILGILNALLSLAYYLKIPFFLFFRPAIHAHISATKPVSRPATWLAVGLVIPTVGLFLKPEWLLNWLTNW